jgi:hypothetical protein
LKAVGYRAEPGRCCRRRSPVEYRVGDISGVVGDYNLFRKPHDKAFDTGGHACPADRTLVYRVFNVGVSDDRSGDKLRKQRNIQQKVIKRPLDFDPAPVDVYDIRHRLKGVKADADRQSQSGQRERVPDQKPEVAQKEVQILKSPQQPEIDAQRND